MMTMDYEKAGLLPDLHASNDHLPFLPPYLSYHSYAKYLSGGSHGDPDSRDSSFEEVREKDARAPTLSGPHRPFWPALVKRHVWVVPSAAVLGLLLFLATFSAGHTRTFARSTFISGLRQEVTMDHAFNATFTAERKSFAWLAEAGDGVYAVRGADLSITLHDIGQSTTRQLMSGKEALDEYGTQIYWTEFTVSSDMRYILLDSSREKVYRHSWKVSRTQDGGQVLTAPTQANFYIHDLQEHTTVPLIEGRRERPQTSIATWAPTGHAAAYVHDNDLFLLERPHTSTDRVQPIQLTRTGSFAISNGIPDWVHEEETFASKSAIWWSPDASRLAYIVFNDTLVHPYTYSIYNENKQVPGLEMPYPVSNNLPYPKPDYPNPTVSLHVFDHSAYSSMPSRPTTGDADNAVAALATSVELRFPDAYPEAIIMEVAWISGTDLVAKQTNRAASKVKTALFDLSTFQPGDSSVEGRLISEVDYAKLDGGWVETVRREPVCLAG
jgi:dipeptidyl aminopeptidase